MDPEFDDGEDEASAMAAAMGFSSFGHKPPAKKRKFNPATDSFVEGQGLSKLDRGGKRGKGSGGNEVALGKTRIFGQGKKGSQPVNTNEIELELGDEDDLEGGLQLTALAKAHLADGNEDEGPQYLDTSLPAPVDSEGPAYGDTSDAPSGSNPPAISESEAAEMQARIDVILESIGSAPPPPSNNTPDYTNQTNRFPGASKNLPSRPPPGLSDTGRQRGGSDASSRGGRGGGRGRGAAGNRNEKWYEDYYDPSFNYNPWKRIEQDMGLEPVGSWIRPPQ